MSADPEDAVPSDGRSATVDLVVVDETELLGWYPALARRGIFRGVDLAALADRLTRLDALRYDGPKVKIRWRACAFGMRSVSYGPPRGIVVSLWAGEGLEEAAETLLHELVHYACPRGESHGELFRRRLVACAREAFGLELDTAALLALRADGRRCRAYGVDAEVVKAMKAAGVGAKLRAGYAFAAPPPVPEEELEERRATALADRRAERLAHAEARHRLAVTRLRRAQTIEKKWRRKVARATKDVTKTVTKEESR